MMRQPIRSAAAFAVLAGLSACAGGPGAHAPAAISAQRFGDPAVANEPQLGYTDDARHIADCLAAHRSYDYRTDRYRTWSGRSRRCGS